MNSKLIFCSPVIDNNNENNTTPDEVAKLVATELFKLGECCNVFPAVKVYHTDSGCPIGGEPAGAFTLSATNFKEAFRKVLKARLLSKALRLPDITLIGTHLGTTTIGFEAKTSGKLRDLAELWQNKAAKLMLETEVYVPCGMVDKGDGAITISATADSNLIRNFALWRLVANKLLDAVGVEYKKMEAVNVFCLCTENRNLHRNHFMK